MNDTVHTSLLKVLWPDGSSPVGQQVYWLLDGARDPEIASLVRSSGLEFACLFGEGLHPRLQAAAPYLVQLECGAPASEQMLQRGWGKAWGILAQARPELSLAQLRRHFKKFLRVKTADGKELAFRFYDPRVLNVYLPTCTNDEFTTFLGPLAQFIAEACDGASVRLFSSEDDGYTVHEVALTASKLDR